MAFSISMKFIKGNKNIQRKKEKHTYKLENNKELYILCLFIQFSFILGVSSERDRLLKPGVPSNLSTDDQSQYQSHANYNYKKTQTGTGHWCP